MQTQYKRALCNDEFNNNQYRSYYITLKSGENIFRAKATGAPLYPLSNWTLTFVIFYKNTTNLLIQNKNVTICN